MIALYTLQTRSAKNVHSDISLTGIIHFITNCTIHLQNCNRTGILFFSQIGILWTKAIEITQSTAPNPSETEFSCRTARREQQTINSHNYLNIKAFNEKTSLLPATKSGTQRQGIFFFSDVVNYCHACIPCVH